MSSPARHVVERWLARRRLGEFSVDLERIVMPLQVFGPDLDFGLAPRQVVICGPRTPLRHEGVAAGLADRSRDLRSRIVNVAEEPRAGRAGEHARGLAVALGQRLVVDPV